MASGGGLSRIMRDRIADFGRHNGWTPMDAAGFVDHYVTTYNPSHDEILEVLQAMFARVADLAEGRGKKLGAEHEQATNPLMRGFGEVLSKSLQADRDRIRKTLRVVFDAETGRGNNQFFAFEQAIKAIE